MARQRCPHDLATLEVHALKKEWQRIFSSSSPSRISREFLLRLLAQGMQERAAGGMPKAIERQLDASADTSNETTASQQSSSSESALRLGTRLVRGWGGVSHEVTVMDRGFAYRGSSYRSLSEIAQLITGTHWSGPRFFGLKKTRPEHRSERSSA